MNNTIRILLLLIINYIPLNALTLTVFNNESFYEKYQDNRTSEKEKTQNYSTNRIVRKSRTKKKNKQKRAIIGGILGGAAGAGIGAAVASKAGTGALIGGPIGILGGITLSQIL